MHLSRFAEEIVIWCSAPYRFIRLRDAFTTGSSIMPQKRNPDAAELVRAKTGRITGALVGAADGDEGAAARLREGHAGGQGAGVRCRRSLALSLAAIAGMVRTWCPTRRGCGSSPAAGFATATDLADWLVRVLRLPFRDAHHATGRLVAMAEAKGVDLAGVTLAEMQAVEPRITADVFTVLTVDASVASRTSYGGTAPANVAREAARWLAALA